MKLLTKLNAKDWISKLAAKARQPGDSWTGEFTNRRKGDSGEQLAYRFLRGSGYRIVARKYKRRSGEIDLIGWDKQTLAFIEVKFRTGLEYGRPEEAVDGHKQRQICRVAKQYRIAHKLCDMNYGFDIVSIQGNPEGPSIRIIKDAFKELS
jgi:putative endonuclease